MVDVHLSLCSAHVASLPLPPGQLGWRLGGIFTFNLAVKLLSRALERDERFQPGSSPGCPPTGPGTTLMFVPGCTYNPAGTLPFHTHLQSHCTPTPAHNTTHATQSKGQWANVHTEKPKQPSNCPTCPLSLKQPWDFLDTRPAAFIPATPQSRHLCF